MKKKDILAIINANQTIAKNKKLLSTIQNNAFNSTYYKNEKLWFPNIPELKDYFAILKKELITTKKETKAAEKMIKESNCTHEVRLNYHHLFSSSNECVLCNHLASSDNTISFKESLYRNKHTVTFTAKYQEDEDGIYEVENGKTKEEIYTVIGKILENFNDEDEIDLVEEFSKLNIPKMTINKEKRKSENYVLIIGGTNQEYVDKENNLYLSRKRTLDSTIFIQYFNELLNTKIAVIEQSDILNNQEIKELEKDHQKVFFQTYTTLDTLDSTLYQVRNIPFKLVIDLTELYDYQIKDDKVTSYKHELNLKDAFPKSHIIKVRLLPTNKEKMEESLKCVSTDMIYQLDQEKKEYYYLEQNEVKKKNSEAACNHLKMLLRK